MEEKYMLLALEEAKKAFDEDEVPIGAVVVKGGKVIAQTHNTKERTKNSLNHAEILAIQATLELLDSKYCDDCDLYVTLEPCPMCAGALYQSRMKNVYFGAYDHKGGSYGSNFNLNDVKGLNHYPNVQGGILEEECSKILKDYFKMKRNLKK